MKTVMKRLILMVLVLVLWGCSESGTGDGARNELVKDYGFKMEEDLKAYIGDHFDVNENYAMGNGIKILNLDKSSEELQMFPV